MSETSNLGQRNLECNYWKEGIRDCTTDGITCINEIKKKLLGDKKELWVKYEDIVKFMHTEAREGKDSHQKPYLQPQSSVRHIALGLHQDTDTKKSITTQHNDTKHNLSKPELLHRQSSVRVIPDLAKELQMKESATTQGNGDEFIKGLRSEVRQKLETVLGTKKPEDLADECVREQCCKNGEEEQKESINFLKECEPFKRLEIVLDAYNQLILQDKTDKTKSKHVQMTELIRIEGRYEHQQLSNDFLHIKAHVDRANEHIRCRDHDDGDEHDQKQYKNVGNIVYTYFAEKDQLLQCQNINNCVAFNRHYRNRMDKSEYLSHLSINDIVFQGECDKIHCYLFHSTIKFGIRSFQTTTQQETEIDNINKASKSTRFSKAYNEEEEKERDEVMMKYIGRQQDNNWWKDVTPEDPKQIKQSDYDIYKILIENMGVFRWQNAHGFKESQYQGIMHNGKKFNNVKEEALNNDYTKLSIDSWNQTLRKAQIFHTSWIGRSVKTKYASSYDDKVAGHFAEWSDGSAITLQEILTLKLYTDFDKLQSDLKKCFRYESVADILTKNAEERKEEDAQQKKKREDLENRLANFYHWRGGLLIVLNKFGTKLNQINNLALYHGVNAKMIIRGSQSYAFYGPLSTTSSFHVARTFATAKGMVLKVTSHFPRLNYCNALDCSSLSDYPEEQEWLVGFMYVRLLQVQTRKLTDRPWDCKHLMKQVGLSSFVRQLFFTIHLFTEQIFSMPAHLERWLKQYLKVNRMECCDNDIVAKYDEHCHCPHGTDCANEECKQQMDWDRDESTLFVCVLGAKHEKEKPKMDKKIAELKENFEPTAEQQKDVHRTHKLDHVLWKKFRQFCKNPNLKQRVKFDMISDCLKRFFMEKDKGKWRISFLNITTVYPNIQEIHFINEHIFDDVVLQRLIEQINRKEQECKREPEDKLNAWYKNTIEKIVFLYYNYTDDENGKPLNSNFKDPEKLNEEKKKELKDLGWEIKHGATGRTGYKIRIYKI